MDKRREKATTERDAEDRRPVVTPAWVTALAQRPNTAVVTSRLLSLDGQG